MLEYFTILLVDIIFTGILIPELFLLWGRFTPPFFSFITLFCVISFYRMILNRLNLLVFRVLEHAKKKNSGESNVVYIYSRYLTLVSCIVIYFRVFWIVCDPAEFVLALLADAILWWGYIKRNIITEYLKRIVANRIVIRVALVGVIFVVGTSYYLRCDKSFQKDSENLVNSVIVAKQLKLSIDRGGYGLGMLFADKDSEADSYLIYSNPILLQDGYSYQPYKSQVGLQGYLFGSLSGLLGKNSLNILRGLCSMLLACIVILISLQIYKRYNLCFAISFFAVSIIDSWITRFSGNLYWIEFSWFIPLLLSLLVLNYSQYKQWVYVCYFGAIFIRSLCGYEYISAIMFSGVVLLLAEAFMTKTNLKKYISTIISIGIMSLLGFVTAFFIHSYIYGGGHIIEGMQAVLRDIVERRTFGDFTNYDVIYKESLTASIGDVVRVYMFKQRGKEVCILIVISIISIMMNRKERLHKLLLLVIGIIIPMSWFVLGKAHSFAHQHMNYVLWYLGYVQIVVYIIMDLVYSSYLCWKAESKANTSGIN